MPRSRALFILTSFLGLAPLSVVGAAVAAVAPDLTSARQALADGLPSVAAVKVERLLHQSKWPRVETRQLATFATECWARAEDGRRMLALVAAYDLDDETFWHAQALALMGNLPAARRVITEDDSAPRSPRTQLLLAQIFTALDENAAARDALALLPSTLDAALTAQSELLQKEIDLNEGKKLPLPPATEDADARYLSARSFLQRGDIPAAQAALKALLSSTSGGERVHHAAALLEAEILLRQNQAEAAQERLMHFLDTTISSSVWTEAFDLLNVMHQALPPPRLIPETILRWISSGNTAQEQPDPLPALAAATAEFCGHALYTTALWLSHLDREDEAVSLLEALLQRYPSHPRLNEAMRLAMEIYARRQADARALAIAEHWRKQFGDSSAEVDSAAAGILFRRGETQRAMLLFENAANASPSLADRRRALYNAGVAAIAAGDTTHYQSLLSQLEIAAPGTANPSETESAAELEIEKALHLAATHKPEAESALRAFIRTRPDHPQFANACVALAEIMLMATPPRIEEAKLTLDTARSGTSLTSAQNQRISYTRLWLLDAAGDLSTLITESASFLKSWPRSQFTPEVRLRLASAHYRLEDYANARTEFEIIARDHPGTPQADTALYFAAMSASSVMSPEGRKRALAIWEELAKKGGPLAMAARRQQALSERLQGHLTEALAAQDKLLAIKSLPTEQRRTTLCEKAEVLLLLGKTEPSQLDAAADLLDSFLMDSTLPLMWKARAGFTLATVHHDAKRDTEALNACYDVLHAADVTPPTNPADYLWFAKAGFFGIDLLEATRQWETAARLAERIASRAGDRANEARERAMKIRLEHFLWDGPAPVPPKIMTLEEKPAAAKEATAPKKKGAR